MKTSIFIGLCVIFIANLVRAGDDGKQTVGTTPGSTSAGGLGCATQPWTGMASETMQGIVCGEHTAKQLANKYKLQLPKETSWPLIDAWFQTIVTSVRSLKMIECPQSSTPATTHDEKEWEE